MIIIRRSLNLRQMSKQEFKQWCNSHHSKVKMLEIPENKSEKDSWVNISAQRNINRDSAISKWSESHLEFSSNPSKKENKLHFSEVPRECFDQIVDAPEQCHSSNNIGFTRKASMNVKQKELQRNVAFNAGLYKSYNEIRDGPSIENLCEKRDSI